MKTKALELSDAFGYLRQIEVEALQVLAMSLKPWSTVVNIGAGTGTSSLAMVEVAPNHRYFTVDVSPGGPTGGMQNEINAFQNAGIPFTVTQILGDSKEVGRKIWRKNPIHMLFVDGDHSEEGCRGDILAWRQWLIPGAIIAFHDYDSVHWPEVKKVVDEEMANFAFLFHVDTLRVFRVPELILEDSHEHQSGTSQS